MIQEIMNEVSADRAYQHIVNITKGAPERWAGSTELRWMADCVRDAMEAGGVPGAV